MLGILAGMDQKDTYAVGYFGGDDVFFFGVRSRCSASLPVWNRRTVMRLWHMVRHWIHAVWYAAMLCGGESFSLDDASYSALDSVLPMKGKYTINYLQYQGVVALRCRVVVRVSLLEVLTSLHGTAQSR